jgi:hypothetical protein
MVSVTPGARMVLRGGAGDVALRVLGEAELVGQWEVPVLASVASLREGAGVVELATPGGLLTLQAHLAVQDGRLALRAGPASEGTFRQRREDVRAGLELPLRGAAVDAAGQQVLDRPLVEGATTTVSGGGVSLVLDGDLRLPPPGTPLYLEFQLPDGDLVPAVVSVVADAPPAGLRARFVDIAPRDRERLVKLVFEAERRLLAQRRLAAGEAAGPRPS